jgi:TIR domain
MEVFVSYSSADKRTADVMVATLERAGLRCWYAPRDITPGVEYGDAILAALRASRVVVVIVSRHSIESQQVLREIERAVHYRLALLPFRIEDIRMEGAFELFLSTSHWLDAFVPPLQPHLNKLIDALAGVLGTPREPVASSGVAQIGGETAVKEVSPDSWSQRPNGRFSQFLSRFLEDSEQ